jgi:hypothetical protein
VSYRPRAQRNARSVARIRVEFTQYLSCPTHRLQSLWHLTPCSWYMFAHIDFLLPTELADFGFYIHMFCFSFILWERELSIAYSDQGTVLGIPQIVLRFSVWKNSFLFSKTSSAPLCPTHTFYSLITAVYFPRYKAAGA